MKYVQYRSLGVPFMRREITTDQWRAVGVSQDTLTWEQSNGWLVPVSGVNEAALPYLTADPELSIVDLEPDQMEWNHPKRLAAADGLPYVEPAKGK